MDSSYNQDAAFAKLALQNPGVKTAPKTTEDTAEAILIDPKMVEFVGRISKVLIVSGTGNFEAAQAMAPADVLVVGLRSATEWADGKRVPRPQLNKAIIRGTAEVTLALGELDDYMVHVQTSQLAAHVDLLGAKSVNYLAVGPGGLSAALASQLDESAQQLYLAALITKALRKLGRRPAAPKGGAGHGPKIAPTVDPDAGITYLVGVDGRQVIMNAAAVRLRTYFITDDLKDPAGVNGRIMHDLVVTWMKDGQLQEREITNVADAQLATPREWLNRLPGGSGLHYSSAPGTLKDIESAIRAHEADLVPEIPVYQRTGWKELPGCGWSFLHPRGAMTRFGNTTASKSMIQKKMEVFHLRDVTNAPHEHWEQIVADNAVQMMDNLTDRNIWYGMFGIAMHTVAGIGVGAVAGLFGGNGSGKTQILKGITAFIAPEFGPDGKIMAVMDDTPKRSLAAAAGLDALFVYYDDQRESESRKLNEQQAEALEYVVRPGYEGGSAGPSTMVKSDTAANGWEAGEGDLSSPARGLVGEEMPGGARQNSTRERIYSMEIDPQVDAFISGRAHHWRELAGDDKPAWHLAYFIRWVAEQMAKMGGKDEWVEKWTAVRRGFEAKRDQMPVSIRVRETGAVAETGMAIWAEYLRSIDVLDDATKADVLAEVAEAVDRTVLRHGTTNVNTTAPMHERILNSLRGAVISGTVTIERCSRDVRDATKFDGYEDEDHETELGREDSTISDRPFLTTLLGVERKGRSGTGFFIALQPRAVLTTLRTEQQFKDLTERELVKAFQKVALTDGGKSYKTVTVNGLSTQALAIPTLLWTPGAELVSVAVASAEENKAAA